MSCLLPVYSTLLSLRQRGSPHPRGDALFLLHDSIRVNRRRRELGMAQPFLHHVEGDATAHRRHAEAVSQRVGAKMPLAGLGGAAAERYGATWRVSSHTHSTP